MSFGLTLNWMYLDDGKGNVGLPEWGRSAAMDADGTVYLSAIVVGDETAVMIAAYARQIGFADPPPER
jgi:hypothetical protein